MSVEAYDAETVTWKCNGCGYSETEQKDVWRYISDMEKRYRKTERLLDRFEDTRVAELEAEEVEEENSALERQFLENVGPSNRWLLSG